MKIHVDRFISNDESKTLEDVISNVRVGVSMDVVNINLETIDKYVRIKANGSLFSPDYRGFLITIEPYIYDDEGDNLYEKDIDQYYSHQDYYSLYLCVELEGYYTAVIIPLKYEYFISYVPDSMCMNHKCLEKCELIVWED